MFFYNFSYLNFAIYFRSNSSSSLIFFFKGSGNARDRLIGIVDPKTSEDDAYKDVIVVTRSFVKVYYKFFSLLSCHLLRCYKISDGFNAA